MVNFAPYDITTPRHRPVERPKHSGPRLVARNNGFDILLGRHVVGAEDDLVGVGGHFNYSRFIWYLPKPTG